MNTQSAAAILALAAITGSARAGEGPQASASCSTGASGQVLIEYSGIWRDACTPRNPAVLIVGDRIELHATSTGGLCLTVLTPYTISGSVGGLCDGVYHTEVVITTSGGGGGDPQRIPGPDVTVNCSTADFNNDCAVSVQDIFDFLAAYFANDPRADVNGSGGVTVQDVFDFLAAYFAG